MGRFVPEQGSPSAKRLDINFGCPEIRQNLLDDSRLGSSPVKRVHSFSSGLLRLVPKSQADLDFRKQIREQYFRSDFPVNIFLQTGHSIFRTSFSSVSSMHSPFREKDSTTEKMKMSTPSSFPGILSGNRKPAFLSSGRFRKPFFGDMIPTRTSTTQSFPSILRLLFSFYVLPYMKHFWNRLEAKQDPCNRFSVQFCIFCKIENDHQRISPARTYRKITPLTIPP